MPSTPKVEEKRYLFDVETNGLLPTLDRIHCLIFVDVETLKLYHFRHNHEENTIAEGVKMLEEADELIGHNIIGFDLKAIKKVFPNFNPKGRLHDTLVTSRQLPYDLRGQDFERERQGTLPAVLIGSHSLDAWGYRLGKNKGDYSKEMIAKGLDPWAEWNQDMEDYCENDVAVNFLLLEHLEAYMPPPKAMDTEQKVQSLVSYMEDQGYPLKIEEAKALASDIEAELAEKVKLVSAGIRDVLVPTKKIVVSALWNDPAGVNAEKTYETPRPHFGEDYSRSWWGDVVVPKRTMKSSDPRKRGDRTEGAPYCPARVRKFSPTSRDHIRDLLRDRYAWEPQAWTKKGNPTVDAKVLNALDGKVPHAKDMADIFTLQKLLGYLKTGNESWIRKYNEETGCIHSYINTGGTVTGRASHHGPNIGQVPSVQLDEDGHPIMGLAGGYGYECRSLFHTPEYVHGERWVQIGVDLSGIEFRMLAEATSEFDDGELIEVVLSGDIHAYNMEKTGITDRSTIKRGLYGLLYGAGDLKLGATTQPDAPPEKWKDIGAEFRKTLMEGLPALKKVIDAVQAEADVEFSENPTIHAIDERKVYCRSSHSALNTKLQSGGAIIAKRWLVEAEEALLDAGLTHGWRGDFVFLAWVHDEIQIAAKRRYSRFIADKVVEAAATAGRYYGMKCRIDAQAKIGQNWAECH